MAKNDTARLTGRSHMPPFSMICPKCKKTYFKPGGGNTSCPECDTGMVDRDKSPTIFAKDVKVPRKQVSGEAPKETKRQNKRG